MVHVAGTAQKPYAGKPLLQRGTDTKHLQICTCLMEKEHRYSDSLSMVNYHLKCSTEYKEGKLISWQVSYIFRKRSRQLSFCSSFYCGGTLLPTDENVCISSHSVLIPVDADFFHTELNGWLQQN